MDRPSLLEQTPDPVANAIETVVYPVAQVRDHDFLSQVGGDHVVLDYCLPWRR